MRIGTPCKVFSYITVIIISYYIRNKVNFYSPFSAYRELLEPTEQFNGKTMWDLLSADKQKKKIFKMKKNITNISPAHHNNYQIYIFAIPIFSTK